ncbi:MAG: phosphoribosyltransferase [Alphaproteobacteria bacterium]|nr:phosphoribosyltransferase [Alphaproteobacteria bacterium]
MSPALFADREDAGRQLAARLLHFKTRDPVVLALPRGGVPVGREVAAALDAPMDLILVRKIGAPGQPELALGAVVDGARPELVINEDVKAMLHVTDDYIAQAEARQLEEIRRRRELWLGDRPRVAVEGKTALIVDDGIATGATVRAALHAVRRARPARLVLAAPVAPPDTIESLHDDADEIVCLATPEAFWAISTFYQDFPQVADTEVTAMMGAVRRADTPARTHGGSKP